MEVWNTNYRLAFESSAKNAVFLAQHDFIFCRCICYDGCDCAPPSTIHWPLPSFLKFHPHPVRCRFRNWNPLRPGLPDSATFRCCSLYPRKVLRKYIRQRTHGIIRDVTSQLSVFLCVQKCIVCLWICIFFCTDATETSTIWDALRTNEIEWIMQNNNSKNTANKQTRSNVSVAQKKRERLDKTLSRMQLILGATNIVYSVSAL